MRAVLEDVEAEALRKYHEDTAPFMETYRIAMNAAFRKAQDEGIRIQDTLGVLDNEAYKARLQAEKELREAEGRMKEVEAR